MNLSAITINESSVITHFSTHSPCHSYAIPAPCLTISISSVVMWLSLLPFVIVATSSQSIACDPACHWLCDDPVCYAQCHAECQQPQCQRCFNVNGTPQQCISVGSYCTTRCASSDQCPIDQCPQCETTCPGSLCSNDPDCLLLCEQPQCGWRCAKPRQCRKPRCVLQCEAPACEAPDSSGTTLTVPLLSLAFVLFILQQQQD